MQSSKSNRRILHRAADGREVLVYVGKSYVGRAVVVDRTSDGALLRWDTGHAFPAHGTLFAEDPPLEVNFSRVWVSEPLMGVVLTSAPARVTTATHRDRTARRLTSMLSNLAFGR